MIVGIADTHAAIWYLFANPRLSALARSFIQSAAKRGEKIGVSSISLAEIVYLDERERIPSTAYMELLQTINDPEGVFEEVPVTQQVVQHMRSILREEVPDLPDRLIAASGLAHQVPVISRDGRIRSSQVPTVW